MSVRSISTALSAFLALGIAAYGHAASARDSETVSVKVKYGDLNLSSEEGARRLLQRIHSAAKTVCGDRSEDPFDRSHVWAPCVAQATNRAVAKLDNPMVTALSGSAPVAKIETIAKR